MEVDGLQPRAAGIKIVNVVPAFQLHCVRLGAFPCLSYGHGGEVGCRQPLLAGHCGVLLVEHVDVVRVAGPERLQFVGRHGAVDCVDEYLLAVSRRRLPAYAAQLVFGQRYYPHHLRAAGHEPVCRFVVCVLRALVAVHGVCVNIHVRGQCVAAERILLWRSACHAFPVVMPAELAVAPYLVRLHVLPALSVDPFGKLVGRKAHGNGQYALLVVFARRQHRHCQHQQQQEIKVDVLHDRRFKVHIGKYK